MVAKIVHNAYSPVINIQLFTTARKNMQRKGKPKSKEQRKKKGKRQQTKFWLRPINGIEILLNFVRNPRKITHFGKKKSFLRKT